ncbi:hypothetical protein ACIBTV_13505 [Micromonospora sp. NPDC049366]|uniref:hypothetical protein n=1 Tax=Micromonospora sp. NPDC049366 TaxID=3364271 RepID=UPI0037A5E8A1
MAPAGTLPTRPRPEQGCPVEARTLDRAPGLPPGYRVSADTVECWRNWASGWQRDQAGDGMYLFRYTQQRGWRVHASGSSFDCAELGIPKDPDDPPPFCTYGN